MIMTREIALAELKAIRIKLRELQVWHHDMKRDNNRTAKESHDDSLKEMKRLGLIR